MAQRATARADFVPHLPDLIVSTAECWRAIRDAQTAVDPFGTSFSALGEARASLESLAQHLTGQHGFFALGDALAPAPTEGAVTSPDGAGPF